MKSLLIIDLENCTTNCCYSAYRHNATISSRTKLKVLVLEHCILCTVVLCALFLHLDTTPISSDFRLVGGRSQYEGRVEVNRSGEWQTVCDDSWDIAEAEVVCRWLGYGYAIMAIQRAAFGQGSGRQWERIWYCNGSEASLDDCSSSSTACSHSEDASVICSGSGKT